jgi:lysine/ornithine N-monooxygenase
MKLEEDLLRDFTVINYPPPEWVISDDPLHVAIVGGGMAGLAAAFALKREGIHKIMIFDENLPCHEGPWVSYARMRHLRSTKELVGPALDIPHLTFQAWYRANYGDEAFEKLGKIPNADWMDYLVWYKKALNIPVLNNVKVTSLEPHHSNVTIKWKGGSAAARKVILATGRGGFGGPRIPSWAKNFPKEKWAHTIEKIDFSQLMGKKIAVVGVGASAFDAAAVLLEEGAKEAHLLMRRSEINNVNKMSHLTYAGFSEGYFYLPIGKKCEFMAHALKRGAVPPIESIDRVKNLRGFQLRQIEEVPLEEYDFYILATGFETNVRKEAELSLFADKISLWREHLSPREQELYPFASPYPYLGPHFQFTGHEDLRNLYCFNHAAFMSHGLIAGDIPGIGTGALRAARGIAQDLFVEDSSLYLQNLKKFEREEFGNFYLQN